MVKERYWKVKTGFGKSEFISIKDDELEKAIYAFKTETSTELGGQLIRGKYIMSIEPYYHKHTGWNDSYDPTTREDFDQIKRDCPDYTGVLEEYKQKIIHLQQTNQINLIGKNIDVKKLN